MIRTFSPTSFNKMAASKNEVAWVSSFMHKRYNIPPAILWIAMGTASLFAGSLEAAYSLNWGAREIWGKVGGETLALLW